jgi:predicted permease
VKNKCLALYRRLARAFPHEFAMVYGADVVRLSEDAIEEIWRRKGVFGLLRLLADLAVRVPAEYLTEFRQDLFYALRTLGKSPGFALVAIVSLGLGIGVNTAVFSEINATLLRDLPRAREPRKLVAVESPSSYPYFERYRDQRDLFDGAAAYVPRVPFSVVLESGVNSKADRVFGHLVSPEYFQVLGVNAARGRVFSSEYDKLGDAPVVVISDRFWRTRLDSDPDAVGRTLRLNGRKATIVGIGPKDFLGVWPILAADVFVPLTAHASVAPELGDDPLHRRDLRSFRILLRLASGVGKDSAEAALDVITRQLDSDAFDAESARRERRVRLLPGGTILPLRPEYVPMLIGFSATLMGLVLMIACANLTNMLLARAAGRRKEVAIRLAVGASRFRIVRQLLTESVVLSICGGLAGLMFAYWLTNLASTMALPVQIPFEIDMRPDLRVLVFAFLLSLITGVGFGLAPAFEATRTDVAPALKESAVTNLRGYRRFGLRNLLIVNQVAGSLMLLLVAGFLVLGLHRSARADLGFEVNNSYMLSLDPVRDGYTQDQASAFFEKLPAQLRRVPAVRDVSLTSAPPFGVIEGGNAKFVTEAASGESAKILLGVVQQTIGSHYFATLGAPVLRGRDFADTNERADSAIVNETAARELFGVADPIGRRIADTTHSYQIVGVTRDMAAGPAIGHGVPAVFLHLTHPPSGGMTLIVRAAGSAALDPIRREVAAIDPNLTLFNLRTMQEHIDQMNAFLRIGMDFYAGLGVFGLILASVGLAGVTAYSVAQRRKEIGIRMALGARRGQVLMLVMREGSTLIAAGCVLGFAGALALSRALSALTHELAQAFSTGTGDPALIVGAPLLLAILTMLACYVPARKSTRVDPLVALREE